MWRLVQPAYSSPRWRPPQRRDFCFSIRRHGGARRRRQRTARLWRVTAQQMDLSLLDLNPSRA